MLADGREICLPPVSLNDFSNLSRLCWIFQFINSPIDRLIANWKQKREQRTQRKMQKGIGTKKKSLQFKIRYASCCRPQVEVRWRYREWKRRHKGCNNKNQARNEFAQSAGNYLHVYTKLKQQTITSRVFPFASARWQRYMYTAKNKNLNHLKQLFKLKIYKNKFKIFFIKIELYHLRIWYNKI